MDIIDDLSTVLKELTVPDLDTQEELEEVEHGIDLQLLSSPSVSFREVVEYCLTATYRATCTAHTLQLVVGDAMKAISGLGSHSALAAVEHASKIVNFVRKSNKAVGFHFVAKNATRWNSQLRMIAALLKAIDKDRKLQSKLNATKKWGELSHHELGMLKELTILEMISKSGESDCAVVAAVKAELEMRAQQLQVSKPNSTEKKMDEPSENQSGSTSAAVTEEFDTFLNEPHSSMRELVDPLKANGQTKPRRLLKFWKNNAHRFPILALIAKDIFSVSASSGSIERYYPSTETKHLYAAAIVKAFPCLVTKIQHPQGKMEINHDVYFHPQAGGFIENHLKEMRRRDGVHKRKPNNKQAQSSGSDDTPKRKNKKKGFWMKRHSSSSIEYSTKIYQYMEKTFEHRQRQSLNIFKSASDVLNEYPRFMDVDNVALIIRDFQAKYPHITDSTFRKRFVDKLSSFPVVAGKKSLIVQTIV
ncbi:uncharacterized protein LOC116934222 [Daphnia magna]|uniref:uncharacterized protein LOC116934222 n=1 Tax=Daphnia magna TaxID=35525 RepID=UPI001E1BAC0B|nr:uncharacterized protein LOC116934222 [Daphnia magna]